MKKIKELIRRLGQMQDKHCTGCGWASFTDLIYCPHCGRELSDD